MKLDPTIYEEAAVLVADPAFSADGCCNSISRVVYKRPGLSEKDKNRSFMVHYEEFNDLFHPGEDRPHCGAYWWGEVPRHSHGVSLYTDEGGRTPRVLALLLMAEMARDSA